MIRSGKTSRPMISRQDAVSSLLRRLPSSSRDKEKSFRVLLLGQPGIGKTATAVRFVTKRFIGDYDPTLERVYTTKAEVDDDVIIFEVLDTAGQDMEDISARIEDHIRWADGYVIMYSINDKCSFDECMRLKFLINHIRKRGRKLSHGHANECPVILVGNKSDMIGDRMVSFEQGKRRSLELACVNFHEISARESYGEVLLIFEDLYRNWRRVKKEHKVTRANTDEGVNKLPRLSPTASPSRRSLEEKTKRPGELVRWISADAGKRSKDVDLLEVPTDVLSERRMSVSMQGSVSQLFVHG
ncbi:PREDICTED: ras-related and estrogen-regulated growth inhibitor-like [Priapulus caudatus]|uniref:small monomeric GTPase n=1 Tax=Priapulus caudatus TaxID=37621 RepID=A0ABM1DSZ7_PRICU|nr:PREDICTED: ras-related and estrogen-regulated growth inhibitor-like [Priapulus caudatus]